MKARNRAKRLAVTTLLALFILPAIVSAATPCKQTSLAMRKSCKNEAREEYWVEVGICRNVDPADEPQCLADALAAKDEALEECTDVYRSRNKLCHDLDEDRYDPDFDPADFTDVFDNRNDYLPIAVGNRWVYEGEDETITVEVLDQTKLIEDVTCIVVNDLVEGEEAIEDTDDWFAQATNGDVHYCGEISRDFEIFEDDDPALPELVAIDGSFKAGRDGSKSGILMFDFPQVGTYYRQEWALGEAEDAAVVMSNNYSYGDDPDLDAFVPQDLADAMCDDDCVVTRDYTPHDPGEYELKYYAPGVGLFLETKPEDGEVVEIVECNLGGRCNDIP